MCAASPLNTLHHLLKPHQCSQIHVKLSNSLVWVPHGPHLEHAHADRCLVSDLLLCCAATFACQQVHLSMAVMQIIFHI